MSGNCRISPKNTRCDDALDKEAGTRICDSFTTCLPFGGLLAFDGECITFTEPTQAPEDGVYDRFVVQNGCITEARKADLPTYTPPPCTPIPVPCDDTGSGTITISPDVANLLYWDSSSRLVGKLFYENSGDVTLSGNGTAGSPLRISANIAPTITTITSPTPDVLLLANPDTNVFTLAMATISNSVVGVHAGFEIDRYGRVVGYTEPAAGGVTEIRETPGNTVVTGAQGVYIIDLPTLYSTLQKVQAGDQELTIDMQGRVSQIDNKAQAVGDRFSTVISGSWTTNTFSFTSTISGRMRISYKGNIGSITSAVSEGLITLPSDIQLLVDTQTIAAYAVVTDGQYIVGIEALTPNTYLAGDHTMALVSNNNITNPLILDISLCQ